MINENASIHVVDVGEKKSKVIVVDDFLADPEALVEMASKCTFTPYPAGIQKKGYPGLRAPISSEYGAVLKDFLVKRICTIFKIDESLPLNVYQEAFSLMTLKENELGVLQTIPHFDASDPNFFAILLYLCDENHGGTSFYRHKSTGLEIITPDTVGLYIEKCISELESLNREPRYFSESDEFFAKLDFIPAKFNRLVVYRGSILHSANILSDISISTDPKKGRLTVNVFWGFGKPLS